MHADDFVALCHDIMDDMDTTCALIAQELSSVADPSDYLAAILEVVTSEAMQGTTAGLMKDCGGDSAVIGVGEVLDRLVTDYMPHFVQVILARPFEGDCAVPVNEFLQRLREGDPSMIPTIHRIFDHHRLFYKGRLPASPAADATQDYAASTSTQVHPDVLRNINFFGDQGGFHVLLCNIDVHMALDDLANTPISENNNNDDDNRQGNRMADSFSFDALVCALKAIAVAVDLFTDAFAIRFLDDLTTALCHYIRRTANSREYLHELDEVVVQLAARVDKSHEPPRRSSLVLVNEVRLEVLDDLLGEAIHPELVKRGATVYDFFARHRLLLPSHMSSLWAICIDSRRHAAILAAVHELFLDVMVHVSDQEHLIDYVFNLVGALTQLETHALATLNVLASSGHLSRVVPWLWSALKANKCMDDHNMEAALALLDELVVQDQALLSTLLVNCVQLLMRRTDEDGAVALRFLSQLSRLMSEGHAIELLPEHRHHVNVAFLVRLVDELAAYKQTPWTGAHHVDQIKRRLLALHSSWILVSSNEAGDGLTLTATSLDALWDHCVTHAASPDESSLFFQWVRLCDNLVPQSHGRMLLSLPLQMHLLSKFQLLHGPLVTQDAVECFHVLFGKVNVASGCLDTDCRVLCTSMQSLEGLPQLWHLAVHASDTTVAEETISKLVGYHLDVVASSQQAAKQTFVDTAIGFFLAAKAQGAATEGGTLQVNRCLDLLRFFLESCGDKAGSDEADLRVLPSPMKVASCSGSSLPQPQLSPAKLKRANLQWTPPVSPTQGPDLHDTDVSAVLMEYEPTAVQAASSANDRTASLQRMEIHRPARVHPLTSEQMAMAMKDGGGAPAPQTMAFGTVPATVVNHTRFFDALFSILDWPGDTSERAWELLCRLPSNRALLHHMVVLRDSRTSAVSWESLLDTSNIPRFLYGLRLVEALLKPLTTDATTLHHIPHRQWRERFVRLGGGQHLYKTYLQWTSAASSPDAIKPATGYAQTLHATCLALLCNTLRYFVTLEERALSTSESPYDVALAHSTLPAFVQQISLDGIAAHAITMARAAHHSASLVSTAVVLAATQLLFATVSADAMAKWADDAVAELVLDVTSRHVSIRGDLCAQLVAFVAPHAELHAKVTRITCELIVGATTLPNELPELLAALLTHDVSKPLKLWMQQSNFCQRYIAFVTSRPSTDSWATADRTLVAHLGVIKLLVEAKVCVEAHTVEALLDAFLFGDDTDCSDVLCKSAVARALSAEIVQLLSASTSVWQSSIAPRLNRFHDRVRDVLDALGRPWNLNPREEARDSATDAGLYNPGCICYMNALLQQLFHLPSFRDHILATPIDPATSHAAEEVAELQAVFVSLAHTSRRWHDPTAFCVSHRDLDGQPTDLRVQMDADEFLGMLLDRVESVVKKASPTATIGALGFGGQLVNQIITEHGHVSEREEPFVVLSLDVQHKHSVEASLASYVDGETLEGDNAYYCEQVQQKVRATKRVCLKTLPDTLVVHLKRFEFDYDTMEKVKLNDYVEFPTQLNMAPYTAESLQRGHSADEAWYTLKGVVVHSGTSDMGHYYSFIQDRDNSNEWWEFNDQVVRPFSVEQLRDECFGGDEVVEKWDPATRSYASVVQSKKRSAYMLVYDRVSAGERPQTTLPMSANAMALQCSVDAENRHFTRLLHAMDGGHLRFLLSLWPGTPIDHQPALLRAIMDLASLLPAVSGRSSPDQVGLDKRIDGAAASIATWFLQQATEDIMPHESAPVVIGDYSHRRTWLFDMTFLCQEPSTRSTFWNVALANVRHGVATGDADIVVTFLEHVISMFFQRDTMEITASCMSTVLSNAPLGAALQPVAAFLEAAIALDAPGAADIARFLVERCHILHHFAASFTVDDCPEEYMQPMARVATFPAEQRLLTRLVQVAPAPLVPSTDVESFLARLACIVSCGFEKLVAHVVAHVVADDADVSLIVIRALLEVLDQVKATHLEAMFSIFTAVVDVSDAHTSLRVAALLSPESGLLEVAEYFKHHRTLHQYTYYVLEFCLTSESPAVIAYLNNVKDQVAWVRPWIWSFLRSDVPVGDLSVGRREEDDSDAHTVLELTEQLFGEVDDQDHDDEDANQENDDDNQAQPLPGALSVGKLIDSSEDVQHRINPAEVES
ncbi:hypothetical protein DYB32_001570 [Aphanomyces invadans]|uniref:ubiquitinyl hydrolase 1 n=1 Tax=Aphanomyces invadans TaxID=157072 RepID=A0A418B5W3_9STRA|nr:hypothetical protein DYB32_001570 [Aphanomyces invadans]